MASEKSKKAKAADEDETDGDLLLDGDAPGDSEEGEEEDAEIDEIRWSWKVMFGIVGQYF